MVLRTLQRALRALATRSCERGIDEIAVLADTGEITGSAACGAEGGEGGGLLCGFLVGCCYE